MPYMDNQNAERLVNTYADTILRLGYMYLKQTCDAEDICQEVFLKLLSHELHFQSPTHEKAWIIRTAINACKDRLRTSFWRNAVGLDCAVNLPAPEPPNLELLELVMTLPKNQRISIYLYYYEGYSVKEIAHMMEKRENTVSAYLSRGRLRLRRMLEADGKRITE